MYLPEKCRTKMNRFYNMWRWKMRFLFFFFGSKFLGSHICIILHGNASPNPLTRSGVLKHVVGSLGTTPSTMKQKKPPRETEVRARGREACVWHTWIAWKGIAWRDPLFEKKKRVEHVDFDVLLASWGRLCPALCQCLVWWGGVLKDI